MEKYVVTEQNAVAGAVVWWELSGPCDLGDLCRALEDEGVVANDLLPREVSLDAALWRAADAALPEGAIIRPAAKGGWEAFKERRFVDPDGDSRVELSTMAAGRVRKGEGGSEVVVKATGPGGAAFHDAVQAAVQSYVKTLLPVDVSSWLLEVAGCRHVRAVPLRQRGGFYFVPQGALVFWRAVQRAVESVSKHKVVGIPAMRTEECARAVLQAVRREAEAAFDEMEAYLRGEVCTRGLNGVQTRLATAGQKLAGYVRLFEDETLKDLQERAEKLKGAEAAVRLAKEAERGKVA